MAHDKYHPCQGLADVMGWAEWSTGPGTVPIQGAGGKKLLVTWGHGALARSWCSVQEALLIGCRFGMDVTLAHPGRALTWIPQVVDWTRAELRRQRPRLRPRPRRAARATTAPTWSTPGTG